MCRWVQYLQKFGGTFSAGNYFLLFDWGILNFKIIPQTMYNQVEVESIIHTNYNIMMKMSFKFWQLSTTDLNNYELSKISSEASESVAILQPVNSLNVQ